MSKYLSYNVVVFIILTITSGRALRCYKCINVVVEDDTSSTLKSIIKTVFNGLSLDPKCGTDPTSSETTTCESGDTCGSITGDISATVAIFLKLHIQLQYRTCMPIPVGCHKPDSAITGLVGNAMKLGSSYVVSDMKIDGSICACDTDLCTDVCEGGVYTAGHCVKNWVIGISFMFAILALIAIITSCCCCCKRYKGRTNPGMVMAPMPPYGMQTTTVMSAGQSQGGQSYGNPGQGYPYPGQGYPNPGQGYPNPGQGYSNPGQGYPNPGQGYPNPGQGYPNPGQGYPNSVPSYPNLDKGNRSSMYPNEYVSPDGIQGKGYSSSTMNKSDDNTHEYMNHNFDSDSSTMKGGSGQKY